MQQIDVTIAKLRLLLADIAGKETHYTALRRQFADQRRKIVEFGVYGDAGLDATLGLMSEVQQRLELTESTLRDLEAIKTRAARELESLQLTKRIEQAKAELRDLLVRQAQLEAEGPLGATDPDLVQQIEALRHQIALQSEQAARTIAPRGA
ncbi:MAG: hypothetical protein U0821_21680 [Chloroflexota bacterium]